MLNMITNTFDQVASWQQVRGLRVVSLIIASIVILLLLAWPKVAMDTNNQVNHTFLMILLCCNSGCFVHGIGYIPTTAIWRWLFTPLLTWPVQVIFLLGLA